MKRFVKNTLSIKEDNLEWKRTVLTSRLGGPAPGDRSISGRIRAHYRANYKPLDQFDDLWYQGRYDNREDSWQLCYIWAIILDCVLNARSAWCESHRNRMPLKQFLGALYTEIGDFIQVPTNNNC